MCCYQSRDVSRAETNDFFKIVFNPARPKTFGGGHNINTDLLILVFKWIVTRTHSEWDLSQMTNSSVPSAGQTMWKWLFLLYKRFLLLFAWYVYWCNKITAADISTWLTMPIAYKNIHYKSEVTTLKLLVLSDLQFRKYQIYISIKTNKLEPPNVFSIWDLNY